MRLEKNSPCKVNLLLNILGRRADGFHELETVLQPIALCDRLTFERCGGAVELACSGATLPVDGAISSIARPPGFCRPRGPTVAFAFIWRKKFR